jgi:hypothetical protein
MGWTYEKADVGPMRDLEMALRGKTQQSMSRPGKKEPQNEHPEV